MRRICGSAICVWHRKSSQHSIVAVTCGAELHQGSFSAEGHASDRVAKPHIGMYLRSSIQRTRPRIASGHPRRIGSAVRHRSGHPVDAILAALDVRKNQHCAWNSSHRGRHATCSRSPKTGDVTVEACGLKAVVQNTDRVAERENIEVRTWDCNDGSWYDGSIPVGFGGILKSRVS